MQNTMGILYCLHYTMLNPAKNKERNPLLRVIYLHNRQNTLMGDLHVLKKIDENSDMKICNNQNFKGPYIARYKNSVQDLFLFIEGAWHESYRF